MNTSSLLTGTLLVLAPLIVLLPGCSGGSSGSVSPTATPTTASPTATLTTAATATPTAVPTATPTKVPTAKPTPTSVPFDTGYASFTYTLSSDSNFVEDHPYYADIAPGGSTQNVSLAFATSGVVSLHGTVQNAVVGKEYSPTSPDIVALPTIENSFRDQRSLFTFQGGKIKVTSLRKNGAVIEFDNAVFAPKIGGNAGGAKGTVTINGTIDSLFNGDFINE